MIRSITFRNELIILAVIVVAGIALRMAFLHMPFDRDEGWYAAIAQEIIKGGIPYRDAIEQKPPGVFYLYAVAIYLFGASVEAIRLFATACSLLTLLLVYVLTRYLHGPVAGLGAAAIFALFSPAPILQGSSSNSEVFLVLPLVASVTCFAYGYDRGSGRLLALSGLLTGCAVMIKTVAVPYLFLLTVGSFFFSTGERSWKRDIGNVAVFLLPQVALALLIIGYFHFHGALRDFLFWTIRVPLVYAKGGAGVTGTPLQDVLIGLSHELLLPFLLTAVSSVWLLRERRKLLHILVVLLFPASLIAALLPGMNFPHYFIQTVPFMAILGGIGLDRLLTCRGALLWAALPVILLLSGNYVRTDYRFYATMPMTEFSEYQFGPDFVTSVTIADYIRKRTGADDFIFQWGFEPELYFLSGRRSPVPHLSCTTMNLLENRHDSIERLIGTLEERKPRYIVYQAAWADNPGAAEIWMLLRRDYDFETTIGYGQIFRLKHM